VTVEQQVKQFLISAPLSGTNYPVDKGGPREIEAFASRCPLGARGVLSSRSAGPAA